jgi:hypothetical protein
MPSVWLFDGRAVVRVDHADDCVDHADDCVDLSRGFELQCPVQTKICAASAALGEVLRLLTPPSCEANIGIPHHLSTPPGPGAADFRTARCAR